MYKNNLPENIYQIRGIGRHRPTALILGGTHGDELAGIEIVRTILNRFDVLKSPNRIYKSKFFKGDLFVGFGNPAAIKKHVRGITERDLNRSFDPGLLKSKKRTINPDLSRAKELAPLLLKVDFLFDIHSTSSPSKPFVCLSHKTRENQKTIPYFYVDSILTDPRNILATDLNQKVIGTTDYFVNTFGKSRGFCYETGLAGDTSKNSYIIKNLLDILVQMKIATEEIYKIFGMRNQGIQDFSNKQTIYELTNCVRAKKSGFRYAKSMNSGWKYVQYKQIAGTYSDGTIEIIPKEGFYLFPKAENKIKIGKSLFYIAQECIK